MKSRPGWSAPKAIPGYAVKLTCESPKSGDLCAEVDFTPVTGRPVYKGKTVLLIDDRAISQSEHSGLMYKSANGTVFIGSPMTGANGDVTGFMAPGVSGSGSAATMSGGPMASNCSVWG